MTGPRRALLVASLIAASAGVVAACGEEGVSVAPEDRPAAALFVEHCSGCHTLGVAGTQGSATNVRTRELKDGPNFDQRKETKECVLYAIRNGGFSSGPMPQNILTGPEARQVADFVARYSGSARKPVPGQNSNPPDCPV